MRLQLVFRFFNDESLDQDSPPDGVEVEENLLIIDSLARVHVGEYKCEAENDYETIEQKVTISMDIIYCGIGRWSE